MRDHLRAIETITRLLAERRCPDDGIGAAPTDNRSRAVRGCGERLVNFGRR